MRTVGTFEAKTHLSALLERVVRREIDPATAASQLLERHTDA